jgi:C-terminal processing protease CtpA/Prc
MLHRVRSRPPVCGKAAENTPQSNYAVFWQTFAEHYAFFELRQTDWREVDARFRHQVTARTTAEELFAIFRQMVEPLHDAHTGIVARDIKKSFSGRRPDPNHLEAADWKRAAETIESKYVRGGLRSFCNGRVQFGMLDGSIGYLRITAFQGYADGRQYADSLFALQSALDSIFRDGGRLRGLVIDVRLNTGGADPLGLEIASRLTTEKFLAYSKVSRNNPDVEGHVRFTTPQPSWVTPSERPGFHGAVVLLTGPDTVSAGETFTMALFGRQPPVTRVGLNTQGVFSDVLVRKLPNSWGFWLPNEVYLTMDGKSFDGAGVPPDIRLPFFSREDLLNGRDSGLDKAREILAAGEKAAN